MTLDTHQEKLSFQAEVAQVLDIVVHSLYSNKEIFLRELISNASDAIDKFRFEALSDKALYESDSDLAIKIEFDKVARTVTISDNGIGMTREEAIDNLGTIAKSGTREFLARLTGDQKKDAHLVGQFGVGFYSAFIVASKVTVLSRRAGFAAEHGVCWESNGKGEYTIANIEKASRGTTIILHLKEDENEFLEPLRLRNIIRKYSDHLALPIMMYKMDENEKSQAEWETVNRATAVWALPKNKVTEEEYKEFYKHVSRDYEDPLIWTHHKVEGGNVDYIALLYLPSHAPLDMWQQDTAHRGLKLYVQRVFIMDNVEQFLPNYLRFVRGILDTSSLPLNISREILQDHHTIAKLRTALVRHVLDLLERMSKDEPEKYATFWAAFGKILKEGPTEDFVNRERVAKLLRFSSSAIDFKEDTVTFQDYVTRMQPDQKKIYYITADNLAAAKSSPHLEIFRQNNIEVLYLVDRIDEWVVNNMLEFEGITFQCVAKGDFQLDEIVSKENAAKLDEDKKEDEQQQKAFEAVLKKIQTLLDDEVKEVRLSHRLTTSPACLVRDQQALGPQLERLLKAAGQPISESKPILELNPRHAIILKLKHESEEGRLKEWSQILYEQALLAEGSPLPDPAAFVQRINKLWMEIL